MNSKIEQQQQQQNQKGNGDKSFPLQTNPINNSVFFLLFFMK